MNKESKSVILNVSESFEKYIFLLYVLCTKKMMVIGKFSKKSLLKIQR
jgi:hypothetical protein